MLPNIEQAKAMLGVSTIFDLHQVYTHEDRRLLQAFEWDHTNPSLVTNRTKILLERDIPKVPSSQLHRKDKMWILEILWNWHHNAISSALRMRNVKDAHNLSCVAMLYQTAINSENDIPHPNQITRLLWLILGGKINEAYNWVRSIEDPVEKAYGKDCLVRYEEGWFEME